MKERFINSRRYSIIERGGRDTWEWESEERAAAKTNCNVTSGGGGDNGARLGEKKRKEKRVRRVDGCERARRGECGFSSNDYIGRSVTVSVHRFKFTRSLLCSAPVFSSSARAHERVENRDDSGAYYRYDSVASADAPLPRGKWSWKNRFDRFFSSARFKSKQDESKSNARSYRRIFVIVLFLILDGRRERENW